MTSTPASPEGEPAAKQPAKPVEESRQEDEQRRKQRAQAAIEAYRRTLSNRAARDADGESSARSAVDYHRERPPHWG